jgi:tRNA A-37 threonylcarbamoyl transferase component Bud32
MTTTRGQNLIGTTLGSCVLERLIGYGGSSAVYLAQQYNPPRKVAVKVFLPRSGMSLQMQQDFYRRFLREAEVASQLDDAHVLPIYSYGEQNGLPYIVMPYMAGGTLSEYIAKNGPLSLQEAQWFLEQMAAGLDYTHQQGYVHCDVKPANMLLDSDERVRLSDFGIARKLSEENAAREAKTKPAESLMGTPDYVSPEQAMGEALNGASDVYSLGITLYYMLAKDLPFKSDNPLALALMHVHEQPPSLALVRLDVTPEIDRVMHKALAKRPADRYRTAGALSEAFAQAVAEAEQWLMASATGKQAIALAARPTARVQPGEQQQIGAAPLIRVKPVQSAKNKVLFWLLACVMLLLVGGVTFGTTLLILAHNSTKAAVVATPTVGTSVPGDMLTDSANWPVSSTFLFEHQQYYILNKSSDDVALALYAGHQYSNFRLTVTMAEVQGPHDGADYFGVVFRCSSDQSHYYLFEIETAPNAQYAFWRYDGQWQPLGIGPAPALHAIATQSNTITIVAKGNDFSFLINNQPLGQSLTDTAKAPLSVGSIGLYVEEEGAEVAFSHLYVQTLA